MKLKPTLNDYTEPEFQALVDLIWAVDLPKADHDWLINHFDRIAGHPKGADLFFYHPEIEPNQNSSGSVVYFVKEWHSKQGRAAFKGQAALTAPPARPQVPVGHAQITQQRIARSLAEVHKINADLASSQRAAEAALTVLHQRINHLRARSNAQLAISGSEADIRALELAEFDARSAVRNYEYWKMHVQFKRDGAQREVTYAQAERGQWQSIAEQISATYDRYVASLNIVNQQLRRFQEQAEVLLTTVQTQLVKRREQQQFGPTPVPVELFAPLAFVNARPAILIDGELSRTLESHRVDLQKSIRSAVAEFTWQITSNTQADVAEYAAVLRFDFRSRAEVGRYGVCVPLAEFLPVEGLDWQFLAATQETVDVPFRMSSGTYTVPSGTLFQGIREIKTLHQVVLAPVNAAKPTEGVRVSPALWSETSQTYSFTAEGFAPITVNWSLPDALEHYRPSASIADYRLGTVRSSSTPLLENFADPETVVSDDYVVVFPEDSGLEPVYLMFSNAPDFAL
jgi:hypothetical protein